MAIYKDENKTKDGRCWYFRVYKVDSLGKRKQYSSPKYLTKQEAKEQEALFLLKRDNPHKKLFRIVALDFLTECKKTKKESTIDSYTREYNKHIAPYFDNLDIYNINILEIRKWSEIMENKGYSIAFLNKIFNVLNCIFEFAMKNYGLKSNPAHIFGRFQIKNDKIVKDENKLRYITYEDFNKFISVVDDTMWKTFFIFAFYTGCRKGEMLALNWNDIDLNNNTISITKTLYSKIKGKYVINSTKTNENRTISISKVLKEQLIEYHNVVKQYEDYSNNWFVFGNTRFLPLTNIDRYKKYYFNLYNETHDDTIQEITMHEFRHSHVSLLANEFIKKSNNTKIDTSKFFLMMSKRMGHSVEVMQRTYMHLFPNIQDEIVDLLDNL